ncbi:anti-sigma factor domain-containing protein [Streptomyces rishiriensis]|uniref:anti-sigma factor n=1 Tax=Streptomyces rishiriensis TaxID=68264 RepID=UPI0037ADD561
MTTREEDPHLAVGAYVLHALPPADEAAFENHLAGCEQCRREAGALLETAARWGGSTQTVAVTSQARARTLLAVAGTRQNGTLQRPRTRGRRTVRPALAASVAAAVAFGGVAAWQHHESDDARARAARAEQRADTESSAIAGVLTAPDATVHTGELTDGTTAAVLVSRSQARAVFAARRLPALTGDRVYELWYAARSGNLRPAGLVPNASRSDFRILKGSPVGSVAVGITIEPAGGSEQPTTQPLGVIPLTV